MPLSALSRSRRFLASPFKCNRSKQARAALLFLLRALVGVWVYAWIAGCAAPPDPSALDKATRTLGSSVRAIGNETQRRLESTPETKALAADFQSHWAVRDHALEAAAAYTRSLVVIYAQAHVSQPQALSASLQQLARSVGIGGSTVSGVAASTSGAGGFGMGIGMGMGMGVGAGVGVLELTADTIAFVHAQIALVEASRTLAEALERAQPVIDRIAALILADTDDLENIVRAVAVLERAEIVEKFDGPLAFVRSLEQRRDELRRVSYSQMQGPQLEELARIEAIRAPFVEELAPYFDGLRSIEADEEMLLASIGAVRDALLAWSGAHADLARAARADQPVDVEALAEAIARMHALIERLNTN